MKKWLKIISFLILPGLLYLAAGCGQTEAEKALQTAKTLTRNDPFSDTEVIRNLQKSERLLSRLVEVKVEAAEWKIFSLRKLINRYIEREMWPLAAREIQKLIELQPTAPEWYLQKGQIYSQWAKVEEDKSREAREAFETALQLDRELLKARYGLGIIHAFRLEEVEPGREYLEDVAYKDPPPDADRRETIKNARFALGRLEHREGNYSAAVEALSRVPEMQGISRDSKFYALKNIGQIYEESGSKDLARQYYLRANQLYDDPKVTQALERLGAD